MPKIIPIRDLKNTAEISELCHETDEPIYVTKNGYGDMVVMSVETFELYDKHTSMLREIEISEQQVRDGKVSDAKSLLNDVSKKYGL